MKRFISLLLSLILLGSMGLSSQEVTDSQTSNETSTETGNEITFTSDSQTSEGWLHENDGKKHWFTALGLVAFWNVGLCSYNRYITGSAWAKVGPDEWNRFWEREMKWDRDWYWTNFVLHPYQGSIYYMGARGANLNPLESLILTGLGSASWEYLCEKNAPSKNDMVYTTVGAFAVGEMLYRLSLESDEISSLLGFAVNPTRLWTQAWTRQKPLGTSGHIHELSLKFSLGNTFGHTQIIDYSGDWPETETYPVFFSPEFYVVYGDPYGHDSNSPYSQFDMLFSAAIGKGSGKGSDCNYAELEKKIFYDIRILSSGMLLSRALDLGENKDTTIGLVMEYDFDWHSYYLLSSLAPGFAFKQRITYDSSKIEWKMHLDGIILGTSDYYYYRRNFDSYYADRSGVSAPYNYNVGFQTKMGFKYQTESNWMLDLNFRGYAMYNFYNQLQYLSNGDYGTCTGWDLVGVASLNLEMPISSQLRIGMSDEFYAKRAFFNHANDLYQFVNTASVYGKVQLK